MGSNLMSSLVLAPIDLKEVELIEVSKLHCDSTPWWWYAVVVDVLVVVDDQFVDVRYDAVTDGDSGLDV